MLRLILLCLLLLPALSQAQPYAFAGTGVMSAGGHTSNPGVTFGAGYRVSDYFALEGAVARFTRINSMDADSVSASVIGKYPIASRVQLIGAASAYRMRVTTSPARSSAVAAVAATGPSGSGAAYGLGIGVSYEPSNNIELRASIDFIGGSIGLTDGSSFSPSREISVTAAYRF